MGEEGSAPARFQMAKTEISLTLHNKFEIPEDDQADLHGLMLRTKRMLVDVIRCSRGKTECVYD